MAFEGVVTLLGVWVPDGASERGRARVPACGQAVVAVATTPVTLYVPNIASTLVTALIRRHRTAPDGAASRAEKRLLEHAWADCEDGQLCCCDCRTSPCLPPSASYGCCR